MSTVVGDCQDCIISVPNNNPLSLKYSIDIQQGINLIIKHRGHVNGYYPSNQQSIQRVPIAPGGNLTIGGAEPPTSVLISTDQLVQVTVIRGTLSTVFNVNQLFVCDDAAMTNVIVANPSDATTNANVLIAYTA